MTFLERLLRSEILQPPCGKSFLCVRYSIIDVDTIRGRLDCVSELTHSEVLLHRQTLFIPSHFFFLFLVTGQEMFTRLEEVLSRFLDLDHLISLCIQVCGTKRDVICHYELYCHLFM